MHFLHVKRVGVERIRPQIMRSEAEAGGEAEENLICSPSLVYICGIIFFLLQGNTDIWDALNSGNNEMLEALL